MKIVCLGVSLFALLPVSQTYAMEEKKESYFGESRTSGYSTALVPFKKEENPDQPIKCTSGFQFKNAENPDQPIKLTAEFVMKYKIYLSEWDQLPPENEILLFCLEALHQLHQTPDQLANIYLNYAGARMRSKKNYDEAVIGFDKALELKTSKDHDIVQGYNRARTFYSKAIALEKLGRNEEAVQAYKMALNVEMPNNPVQSALDGEEQEVIFARLITVLNQYINDDETYALLLGLKAKGFASAKIYAYFAEELQKRGEKYKSIEIFKELLEFKDERQRVVWRGYNRAITQWQLASLLNDVGQKEEAAVHYTSILNLKNKKAGLLLTGLERAKVLCNLVIVLEELGGRDDRVGEAYKEVLRLKYENGEPLVKEDRREAPPIVISRKRKRTPAQRKRTPTLSPHTLSAGQNKMDIARFLLNEKDEELSDNSIAFEESPQSRCAVLCEKGRIFEKDKKYKEALEVYETALLIKAGRYYALKGNHRKAIKAKIKRIKKKIKDEAANPSTPKNCKFPADKTKVPPRKRPHTQDK